MWERTGRKPKCVSREEIERAVRNTLSNRAAAHFLSLSYPTYKKWALFYKDSEGKSYYEKHWNKSGKGIKKYATYTTRGKKKITFKREPPIMDILEGRVPIEHYKPEKIKRQLVEMGLLKPVCDECGYHEKRALDGKSPLVLVHKNGNKKDYHLDNLAFRCYNCLFLDGGVPISEEQVNKLENYATNTWGQEPDWELDEYQKEYLKTLGLGDSEIKSGSEYIATL